MCIVDYEMAEQTAKIVLIKLENGEIVPSYIFQNMLTAIANLTIHNVPVGKNVCDLYDYLNARYTYDDVHDLNDFDIGVVYGATQLYNKIIELKE